MSHHSIYHQFNISSNLEKVYKYITKPEHLVNWWPMKCFGQPKVGEIYNFNFTDKYDWYGKVIQAVENKSFHIKMTKSDDNWNSTIFGFDLEETKNNIVVKFFHKDWIEINDEFRYSSFCWAILLNGLKNYIEKGIVIPFEERE